MLTRQEKMIVMLIESKQPLKIDDLAQNLSCSPRTIRNDLTQLEKHLPIDIKIKRKPGIGISLLGNEVSKRNLLNAMQRKNKASLKEAQERQERILFHLLMRQDPITLGALAEHFFESKKVIREDLEHIGLMLGKEGLTLHIQTRVGIYIEGNEKKKRDFLAAMINETPRSEDDLIHFFKTTSIVKVNHILARYAPELLEENVQKNQLSSIAIHILFMIARIEENASVQLRKDDRMILEENKKALQLSEDLTRALSESFGIDFPDDEIGYLALRIANYQIEHGQEDAIVRQKLDEHIEMIVDRLIDNVENILQHSFQGDRILRENLIQHLTSSFARIRSGFHIKNPLKDQIKKTYLHLFLIIQTILDEFVEQYGFRFPEEELAYLTVHFQAALERKKDKDARYRVALISNHGIGVATFIATKLEYLYPQCQIVTMLTKKEYESLEKTTMYDFIISTESNVIEKNEIVYISPLFNDSDQKVMASFLYHFVPQKIKRNFDIHRYTHSFLIYPQEEMHSKEEVLLNLCQKLEQKGYVDEKYRQTVLEREKHSSTHIGSLIAIPHGKTQHIKESSLVVTTLKKPIDWGMGDVQIIFLLALKKEDLGNPETKNLFRVLYELINNKQKREKIISYSSTLDIMKALSYYEE